MNACIPCPRLETTSRYVGRVSARADDHTTNQNIGIKELFLRDGIVRQMTHIQVRAENLIRRRKGIDIHETNLQDNFSCPGDYDTGHI